MVIYVKLTIQGNGALGCAVAFIICLPLLPGCLSTRLLRAFGCVFDLKLTATALLTLRRLHRDFKHAVLERCRRVIGTDPFRQRNLAVEATVRTF